MQLPSKISQFFATAYKKFVKDYCCSCSRHSWRTLGTVKCTIECSEEFLRVPSDAEIYITIQKCQYCSAQKGTFSTNGFEEDININDAKDLLLFGEVVVQKPQN